MTNPRWRESQQSGDGTDWNAAFVHPADDAAAGEAQFDGAVWAPTVDTDALTGQLTDGASLTDIAGNSLSISNGRLDASTGGGGGASGNGLTRENEVYCN